MESIIISSISIFISTITIIFNVSILIRDKQTHDNSISSIKDRDISLPKGTQIFPENE